MPELIAAQSAPIRHVDRNNGGQSTNLPDQNRPAATTGGQVSPHVRQAGASTQENLLRTLANQHDTSQSRALQEKGTGGQKQGQSPDEGPLIKPKSTTSGQGKPTAGPDSSIGGGGKHPFLDLFGKFMEVGIHAMDVMNKLFQQLIEMIGATASRAAKSAAQWFF